VLKTHNKVGQRQCEQELFHHYRDHLNAYLVQCAYYGYSYGKCKVLCIVNEGVKYETHTILEYWSFHSQGVDEVWDMLK